MLSRRATLLALAASLLPLQAALAQPTRTYAILSLCADKLDIVSGQMSTGSHMDRNIHQVLDLNDDGLEIVAVQAAEAAIKQAQPQAAPELFVTRSAIAYAAAELPPSVSNDASDVLDGLKAVVAQTGASHLLPITKNRDDARMELADSTTGMGKVKGLGFFIDNNKELVMQDSKEFRTGYVAAFASLRFRLIDLKARKTVVSDTVQITKVYPTPSGTFKAWDGLTAADKVSALQRVLREAVGDGVSRLLAKP
jgi:hypothetical protein